MARQRCVPTPGTMAEKSLYWRPPDPVWAPHAALAKARAALKAYDPYLDLRWAPVAGRGTEHLGRWGVYQWNRSMLGWDFVMYWQGPNGEYRDEFPTDQLLCEVYKRSLDAQGVTAKQHLDGMDRANAEREKARETNLRTEAWKESAHKAHYDSKQRFGVRVQGRRRARLTTP